MSEAPSVERSMTCLTPYFMVRVAPFWRHVITFSHNTMGKDLCISSQPIRLAIEGNLILGSAIKFPWWPFCLFVSRCRFLCPFVHKLTGCLSGVIGLWFLKRGIVANSIYFKRFDWTLLLQIWATPTNTICVDKQHCREEEYMYSLDVWGHHLQSAWIKRKTGGFTGNLRSDLPFPLTTRTLVVDTVHKNNI